MTGRVIHTGQAIVDVVMQVTAVPKAGEDVFARGAVMLAGGGFNVMAAARREEADVLYAGGLGTGPLGDIVRRALESEGVQMLLDAHPEMDTGFCVAMVDDDAERTFVSTVGAEGQVPVHALDTFEVRERDVMYVSGYSLHHPSNAAMLARALPRVAEYVEVVVDASPVIGDIPAEALECVMRAATIWTVNEREARILAERVLEGADDARVEPRPADLAARLAGRLDAVVIVRVGSEGSWVARPGEKPFSVPGIEVTAVDTNGAGDAHTGVLCADLGAGLSLETAVSRANVAAGIAVTRRGPAISPTAAEITERRRCGATKEYPRR